MLAWSSWALSAPGWRAARDQVDVAAADRHHLVSRFDHDLQGQAKDQVHHSGAIVAAPRLEPHIRMLAVFWISSTGSEPTSFHRGCRRAAAALAVLTSATLLLGAEINSGIQVRLSKIQH